MTKLTIFNAGSAILVRGLYRVGGYFIVLGVLLAEFAAGVFVVLGLRFNVLTSTLLYWSVPSTVIGIVLYLIGRWIDDG